MSRRFPFSWVALLPLLLLPVLLGPARSALANDRVVFGSSAEVREDEVVEGDVVVFGGSCRIAGHVTGDAVIFGGKLVLEETGVVDGDLVSMGGTVERYGTVGGESAAFGGDSDELRGVIDEAMADVELAVEDLEEGVEDDDAYAALSRPERKGFWAKIRSFFHYLRIAYMALIGILILLEFSPDRILNITRTVELRPGRSLLAGLLTTTAFFLLMALLAISFIGIPVAALVYLGLWGVAFPGVMAVCGVIARKLPLGRISGSTGAWLIGALLLLALPFITCIGPLLFNLLFVIGLGAAVLSRFGVREPVA